MRLQACSLSKQQELSEPNLIHVAHQVPPRLVECRRHPTDEIVRPLEITGAVVSGFKRPEQGVVVQPVSMVPAKLFEGRTQIRSRTGTEVLPCRLEQGVLEA